MKQIIIFLNLIWVLNSNAQSINSVNNIHDLTSNIVKSLEDGENKLDIVRFETGILSVEKEYLFDQIDRKLYANISYIISAYTDSRVKDIVLIIEKKNSENKWETVKKSNENKNSKDPLGDIETLSFTPEKDDIYRVLIGSLSKDDKTARYGLLFGILKKNQNTDNISKTCNNYDTNLKKTLDESGLSYKVNDKCNFTVEIKTEDNRTQIVTVNSKIMVYEGVEIRELWTGIKVLDSKNALSFTDGFTLLTKNAELKMGAWQISGTEAPYLLNFSLMISANTSPTDIKSMIIMLATQADIKEKEITNQDKY
jgi:hypothetical protein